MTTLKLYQVDAFTDKLFGGNPAAVCPLNTWLEDELLQKIALENNLSETAFFVPDGDKYQLRWFTPIVEVKLCGHATLGAAFVIFNFITPTQNKIIFKTLSGELIVTRDKNTITLDFPAIYVKPYPINDRLNDIMGYGPLEAWIGDDIMVVLENEDNVRHFQPNYPLIQQLNARGFVITAPGDYTDFVSRWFGPKVGVNEDPVTGSAHCMLAPYWANRLNCKKLYAEQISQRLGKIHCEIKGNRVLLSSEAKLYMRGEIYLPSNNT